MTLYTIYPIVARTLGRVRARAKVSRIQSMTLSPFVGTMSNALAVKSRVLRHSLHHCALPRFIYDLTSADAFRVYFEERNDAARAK